MRNRKALGCLLTLLIFLLAAASPADGRVPEEPSGEQQPAAAASHNMQSRKLSLSELRQKYADTFTFRGPRSKQIALTFDDVPDPRFTPQILDILKKKGVKATFFVVGERAQKHPDLVLAIKRDGHVIGNHSYNHPQFKKLSLTAFQRQIRKTERILYKQTGIRPRLIRPPYGEINEAQLVWARNNGYKIVNWDVDSLDWKGIGKEEVKQNILGHVGPGSIILQHAGGGVGSNLTGTIQALPDVIDELRKQGYRFVTVSELIHTTESKPSRP